MLKMPSLRLLAIGVLLQCSTSATVPGSSQSADQEAQGCIPRAQPVRDEQDLEQTFEAARRKEI